ncbi:MAG: hypothetical protein PVH19_10905 [Planctomycetia bacterium]|jgi:hypothetical protein
MRWLTVWLTCHLILCTAVGVCAEPTASTARSADALVREAGPPVFYLKDQEGQLVPMLGFGYEDFMKWFREGQDHTPRPQPAAFTIDQAEIRGTVADQRANLDISLAITTRKDDTIRVPVGLSQAIMRKDLKYEGEGNAFLEYDVKKKTYVVWIEGKKSQKHKITLSTAIPTATIGLDTRLRFDAPRSTRSQMTLAVPEVDLEVNAPIESRLTKVEDTKAKTPETRLTIDSVRGDFQLLWHKNPNGSSKTRAVMEASGEIVVNIGSLDITCEAVLKVRGRGMPIDRFRVRLPKGTETYQVSEGDYQVIELENKKPNGTSNGETSATENGAAKKNNGPRTIEVRLAEPTVDPILLRISTTRPLDRSSLDSIEPAGFQVIDAVRQWGHVAATVGPDYYVSWSPRRGIRRVDRIPDSMNVKNPTVMFEYYSAPFLLQSQITPRRTRVSVEPKHIVHVGADQLQLESMFSYTIRGKEVLSLQLDLRGWELDKIGPETLVDANRITVSSQGLATIPLLSPTIGHVELKLEAHRAAPQKETKLSINFPCPHVDSPGPAEVVIQPEDNVKLLPDTASSTGLTRLQTAPSIPLPERQQAPLYYRGDAGQATFSAERSIHQQQVSVDMRSTIAFEKLNVHVEQLLTYQIDHEQSDQIVLEVPESIVHGTNLEFLVDGVPVVSRILDKWPDGPEKETPEETSSSATSEDTPPTTPATADEKAEAASASKPPATSAVNKPRTVPMVLTLPSARIGRCVVAVRYLLSSRTLTANTPTEQRIPLVLPSHEPILHHEMSIITSRGLMVDVLEDKVESSPIHDGTDEAAPLEDLPRIEPIVDGMISKADFATGTRQNFDITGRLGAIRMLVSMEKRHQTPPTTIHRAFFQTWVTDREYAHRAIFQFQAQPTLHNQIEITMPEGTIEGRIAFSLGGLTLPFELLGDRRYLLTLPEPSAGLQELELQWWTQPSGSHRSLLRLGMPQLGEDAWIQRWYWQLLLPTGKHLVSTPREVLSESAWQWEGGLFQREPLMDTAELERWVGSKTLTEKKPQVNLYLFSSFGAPEEITFRVANRSFIVLSASGLVLIVGFLLIYVPVTRHPAVLLTLGVALGSLGVIYTEPILLGLQASALGVILVGVTMILKRRLSRPKLPTPIPIAESGGSSILDRDSTQRQVILPPIGGSQTNQPKSTETQLKPPE